MSQATSDNNPTPASVSQPPPFSPSIEESYRGSFGAQRFISRAQKPRKETSYSPYMPRCPVAVPLHRFQAPRKGILRKPSNTSLPPLPVSSPQGTSYDGNDDKARELRVPVTKPASNHASTPGRREHPHWPSERRDSLLVTITVSVSVSTASDPRPLQQQRHHHQPRDVAATTTISTPSTRGPRRRQQQQYHHERRAAATTTTTITASSTRDPRRRQQQEHHHGPRYAAFATTTTTISAPSTRDPRRRQQQQHHHERRDAAAATTISASSTRDPRRRQQQQRHQVHVSHSPSLPPHLPITSPALLSTPPAYQSIGEPDLDNAMAAPDDESPIGMHEGNEVSNDGTGLQHHQSILDYVFEMGKGEGEAATCAAGRCSTLEQDVNTYSQLEKDIFGGDSDLEDEYGLKQGRNTAFFPGLGS